MGGGVSEFIYNESKFKMKKIFFVGGSKCIFLKRSKSKIKKTFLFRRGEGGASS